MISCPHRGKGKKNPNSTNKQKPQQLSTRWEHGERR